MRRPPCYVPVDIHAHRLELRRESSVLACKRHDPTTHGDAVAAVSLAYPRFEVKWALEKVEVVEEGRKEPPDAGPFPVSSFAPSPSPLSLGNSPPLLPTSCSFTSQFHFCNLSESHALMATASCRP